MKDKIIKQEQVTHTLTRKVFSLEKEITEMRNMNKKDDVNEDLEISQSINKKVSEAKEDTGVKNV